MRPVPDGEQLAHHRAGTGLVSDSMFTTPTSGLSACTDSSGVCDVGEKLAHAQGW
jgi:hypothetical protein